MKRKTAKQYSVCQRTILRVAGDILLLILVFVGPWWLVLSVATLLILFVGAREAVLGGFMFDILYAHNGTGLFHNDLFHTYILVGVVVLSYAMSSIFRGVYVS